MRITSAEFQKAFGRYRESALREPVTITNHGRDCLVLLSAEEYRRLKSQDRRALFVTELSDEYLQMLAEGAIPDEASRFDHEVKS